MQGDSLKQKTAFGLTANAEGDYLLLRFLSQNLKQTGAATAQSI